jgi:hypothetical protein
VPVRAGPVPVGAGPARAGLCRSVPVPVPVLVKVTVLVPARKKLALKIRSLILRFFFWNDRQNVAVRYGYGALKNSDKFGLPTECSLLNAPYSK